MRDDLKLIVQAALDVLGVDQAIKIGKLTAQGSVEWIEAGTPLNKRLLELGKKAEQQAFSKYGLSYVVKEYLSVKLGLKG